MAETGRQVPRDAGFTLLYTLTKIRSTKWGAEIKKNTCPMPTPSSLFVSLYPSPQSRQQETGEGNNYTKFSTTEDTVQRPIIHDQQAATGGSVQLVQVK